MMMSEHVFHNFITYHIKSILSLIYVVNFEQNFKVIYMLLSEDKIFLLRDLKVMMEKYV